MIKQKSRELGITHENIPDSASFVERGGSSHQQRIEDMTGETLLKTIKVPTNLANLSSRLPKSNYVKTRASEANILTSFTKDGVVKSSSVR